jgi:aspartyl-tRNA(Asn)/glutamyl-tRNA(Gln) amidotransferase subunit A
MNELLGLSIVEVHELLLRRELGSVELIEATLDEIGRTEPVVHAYAHVLGDSALDEARALDAELARGRVRGVLHGIPIAVKDNVFVAGAPLHAGSSSLVGHRAAVDADVVARLRAAGAVVVGKTVTHEFALAPERGDGPEARNPWRTTHLPGGSSAGSAIAPVVGTAFATIGTDTAGSVRGPAAWCAATGLKPTFGRLSRRGVVPLSASLDHVGLIARTAGDCSAVLSSLVSPGASRGSGEAAGQPASASRPRIGVPRDYAFGPWVAPEVSARVEEGIAALRRLGAEIVDVPAAGLASAPAAGIAILLSEALAFHRSRLRRVRDGYCPANRALLAAAERIPAWAYVAARRERRLLRDEMARLFAGNGLDAMVTPTLPFAATPAAGDADELSRSLPDVVRCTLLANLTGQPALSVPCGLTPSGLPVGMQLLGRPFADESLLALACGYERETGWAGRRALGPAAQMTKTKGRRTR